ncbi:MAG: phosphoglucomutase/phosphomannomutase family protein [Coriobacteriales bacterium]|nr:phosphoglucomutase/phosphomannomutase family protein [Coriobacteriales bacterium]
MRVIANASLGVQLPGSSEIRFGTDGWRAVIADDFTYANLRRVADAAGRVFAADSPGGRIIVGYDTRFEAGNFARAAAEVIATHGLDVLVSDRYVPTPTLCWAVAHDDAAVGGVMLTASHNPAEYNGFKLRMADGGASPVPFTQRVEDELRDEAPTERGMYAEANIASAYIEALRDAVDAETIRGAGLRVVVDSLYGAGREYLADTLEALGVEVIALHGTENPAFGGLHPEPIPPWVDEARELVRMESCDAGFFTDGDADRIGACDRHGEFVNPHRIIGLLTQHLVTDKGLSGRVIKTVSTSVLVDRLGQALGLEVVTTPVGFKGIYEEMVAGNVLLGGEESGGIGIPTHVRERDGLLMALLLTEMMAQRGKGLGELVTEMFEVTGPLEYSRVDLRLTPEAMASFRERMPELAPTELGGLEVLEIQRADGIKFLLPDDAWLLLRTSGTEPLVRVYAEASSAGVVDDLLAAGRALADGSA